ncbi:MAG: tripartite tricarboxylate transporter substrate binding protein, partial [Acetobacteraceae bacterium]
MVKPSDAIPGRRLVMGAAAGMAVAAPWVARAQAGFPNRPITMIIPFPPGGTTDVTLRALAEGASRHLQQQVVVDNRPGAANTLGAAMVARARP